MPYVPMSLPSGRWPTSTGWLNHAPTQFVRHAATLPKPCRGSRIAASQATARLVFCLMAPTSLSLLERARRDPDSDAWRRLAELYTPLLSRWMARYGIQPSDADDLVKEVLMTVAKELPRFEHVGRPDAFRAWVKSILTNRLTNYWRSQWRHAPNHGGGAFLCQLHDLEDPRSHLSRLWDREHDQMLLGRLLEIVSSRFQPITVAAFRGVALEGRPAATVAQDLGLSLNAVVIAKCRVIRELRREAQDLLEI